ncbi:MAG: monovalent cation:proton antiporter-2 (CPA2) family protein [Woeseiaceae bacterium]|nr:monovalent cation:proton antiporter-2 (CPA2) family protein [Woeseiaceae bacterium]
MSLLAESVIYLLAALVCVPICRRLGFGSVLGYLAAGILIGPFGLRFIGDAEHVLHFAELGVVFLLFIIGLELQPSRLWVLRRMVFGLGLAQVLVTAVAIAALAIAAGVPARTALVIGPTLALSSTAFVLQMLAERKQLTSAHGRAAFSVLLFQDLAVIPLIALIPLLADAGGTAGIVDLTELSKSVAILLTLIVGGRYLLRPVLSIAAASRLPELFTATALLVVIGSALLMQLAGMSMVLGAFIAGILLADSEYRHQLEGDIAPFKGLLLGLFFIAVGMSVDISMLVDSPARIAAIVIALMLTKALVMIPLARAFGDCGPRSAVQLAAAMSQGGEFAFVLFSIATREGLLPLDVSAELTLAVTVSMMLTPFLYLLAERIRVNDATTTVDAEPMPEQHNEIIIAGFGRVGQIVGRILRSVGRSFTALEADAGQLSLVRKYGSAVHFGDASRLDVLRAAGAEHAKLFVLAVSDMEQSLKIAETVKRNFPNLTIVARAWNRRHAHKLMGVGVTYIFRETLLSSVAMGERVLQSLGLDPDKASNIARTFLEHDERLLNEQFAIQDSEEKLVQSSQDTMRELEELLKRDPTH